MRENLVMTSPYVRAKNKNDFRQNERKITNYRQEKINQQPAWSNIVGIFVSRNKSVFFKLGFYLPSFCQKYSA